MLLDQFQILSYLSYNRLRFLIWVTSSTGKFPLNKSEMSQKILLSDESQTAFFSFLLPFCLSFSVTCSKQSILSHKKK